MSFILLRWSRDTYITIYYNIWTFKRVLFPHYIAIIFSLKSFQSSSEMLALMKTINPIVYLIVSTLKTIPAAAAVHL